MSQVAVEFLGDNGRVPFPAVPLPVSFAIGIPVALAAYVAQELVLRRRRIARTTKPVADDPETHLYESLHPPDVTAAGAADAVGEPVDIRETAVAVAPAAPRKRAAGSATAASPVAAQPAGESRGGPATRRKATPRSEQMAAVVPAVTPPVAARSRQRPAATPKRPPAVPAKRPAANPTTALTRRRNGMKQALDAIIDFVDAPPRRAAATVCADALVMAVPRTQRGPDLEAFLQAAGSGLAPSRLQELAEDAGVEVATAIKEINARIRELSPG